MNFANFYHMATRQKTTANQPHIQSLIDCSLDVIQIFKAVRDKDNNIVDFIWVANNKQAVEQNGDVIGKSLIQQNPGVVPSGIFYRMVQVTETGVPQRYEQNYSYEQFRSQWFYQSIVKYEDGVVSTTRDITAMKMAEQLVIRSNNLLQSVFDSSLNTITVVEAVRDKNGDIIDFKYLLTNTLAKQTEGGDPFAQQYLQRHPEMANTEHFNNLKMVVETGNPAEWICHYDLKGYDKWYKVKAVKIGDGVAVTADDITEQKMAEQNILRMKDELAQRITDKYHRIIESMDEGFCIIEVIFNKRKKAVDYRFLEVNAVFEHHTGLTDVVGKTMRELEADIEEYWFQIFGNVAVTGIPSRFQHKAKPLNRRYDVYAFRIDEPEEHHVAVLFNDIAVRKSSKSL
jgi:PAS domain-containing protein